MVIQNAQVVTFFRSLARASHAPIVDPIPSYPRGQKKRKRSFANILKEYEVVFQREIRIDYKCIDSQDKHFARLDFVLELPTKRVFIEVDERQHHDTTDEVSCDLARMMLVTSAIACSRLVTCPPDSVDPIQPE